MNCSNEFARLLVATSTAGPLTFELFDRQRHHWSDLIAQMPFQPVGYARHHVDYQHAYFSEFSAEYAPLDCIISRQGVPVGVWPLAWIKDQAGNCRISSNINGTSGVAPPLLAPNMPEKTQKSGNHQWLGLIGQLANACSVEKITLITSAVSGPLPHWHRLLMETGANLHCSHRAQADLTIAESIYHGNLRKSYKALINNARKHWTPCIDTTGDREAFTRFEALHIEVAGRRTRSEESWNSQFNAILDGEAFALYLTDAAGKLVGASLFNLSRDEALYAIGAYDRKLFDKPLAHLSLYEAITHLRQHDIQRLILGNRPYPGDRTPPSDKELQIAFFKEGFATELILVPYFDIDSKKLRSLTETG